MPTPPHQGELLALPRVLAAMPWLLGHTKAESRLPQLLFPAQNFYVTNNQMALYHVPAAILSAYPSKKLYEVGITTTPKSTKQERVRHRRLSNLPEVTVEAETHAKAIWLQSVLLPLCCIVCLFTSPRPGKAGPGSKSCPQPLPAPST